MIEDMFWGMPGWRTHISLASVMANTNQPAAMVEHLEEAVKARIDDLIEQGNLYNWEKDAGSAFYNLAKTLDSQGGPYKQPARKSLSYALKHFRKGGVKIKLNGLSRRDIREYVENPNSSLSLSGLEILEMRTK